MRPDIWLAQHNEYYDLEGKCERAGTFEVPEWDTATNHDGADL
jgi:metallo-beta-lactamase class B